MALNKMFSTLIQSTVTRLSMVAGASVQLYAEDRIASMLQHKFDVLFDEEWWPQFMSYETVALDGETGVVTADLVEKVKRYEDLQHVFIKGDSRPLPQFSAMYNPEVVRGTTPQYIIPINNAHKVFKVLPAASIGDVVIKYRTKPDDFDLSDTVPFDSQALILGAVYDYLEDDGTNPGATEKFQGMFEHRVKQLKLLQDHHAVSLHGPNGSQPLRRWTDE